MAWTIRRTLLLGLVSVLALSTAGCKPAAKKSHKIVVGYLPIIAHLPAAIAQEKGLFDDQLEVEFRVYSNSNTLLSDLAKGKINAATTVAVAPVVGRTHAEIAAGKSRPARQSGGEIL